MVTADPRARLLALAGERGSSLSKLSVMIGRNPTYLQQFVRKGSPRRLEERDRRTLARFFGIGESELGAPKDISSKPQRNGWIAVPRLALGASAGPGAFAAEERPIGTVGFDAAWFRRQGLDPAMLSTIAVAGDSMEPALRDGDEILVDRTPRPLRDGIHVVRAGDALMVKRVQTGVPGRIVLESENKAYSPIDLPAGEVEVIGRVVWKSGRL